MSDDIDFDDWDDSTFDFGDFDDFNSEPQDDDRNPAIKVGKQVGRTVYGNVTDTERNIDALKDSLPRGFRRSWDVAEDLKDSGERIYRKAMEDLHPTMRDLSQTARRITPRLRTIMPDSMVDKIDGWLDKAAGEGEYGSEGHPTKEQVDNQIITGKLEDIFRKQMEVRDEERKEETVKKYLDDRVEHNRHRENKSIQAQLLQLASDEADYRASVLWRYQKESLEVGYRQLFIQRDLLENFNKFASIADSALQAITKNTALPEATKIKLDEQYKIYAQEALFGKMHSSLASRASGFFNRVKDKSFAKAEEFIEGLKGNLDAGNQIIGMVSDQLEAQEQMGDSSGVSGMIIDGAVGKLGNMVREELGKHLRKAMEENQELSYWNAKASQFLNNPDELFQGFMDAEDDGSNWDILRKVMRFMEDEREEGVDVTHNLAKIATDPVPWDVLQRRYITEVYPEYYSRMLQQLEIIASGNQDVERLVYSTKREAMVGRSLAVNDSKEDVYSDSQLDALAGMVKEFIENIDDENRLSTDARSLLGRTILKEVRENRTFDPTKFSELSQYGQDKIDEDVKAELAGFIGRKYKVSEGVQEKDYNAVMLANQAMNRAKNIKGALFDAQTPINQYNALSQKALLRDAGVISNEKDGTDKFVTKNLEARVERALEYAVALARETVIKEGLAAKGLTEADLGPQPSPELLQAMSKQRVDAKTPFERKGIENEYRVKPTETRVNDTPADGKVNVKFPKHYPLPDNQMNKLLKALGVNDVTLARDELKELQYIRKNTDVLPELMDYLKNHALVADGDGDGVVKKGLADLVSGLWGGVTSYGRGLANVGKFGLDTVGGIRDVVFGALGGRSKIDDDQKDLYVKGGWRPRLTAARLAAGEYFDEVTGEAITSWKDIKGAVKDAKGNIILSLEDFKKGFRDQAGKDMLVNLTRNVLSAPFKAMGALAQLPATLFSLPGKAWTGLTDYYNARKDVYSADGRILLYYHRMRSGEYFDKESGKVIRSVEDIKGEVIEYDGNGEPVVVISMADLDKGPLCDAKGKPIRTLNLKNLVLGTAGLGAKVISAVAKTAWNVGSTVITDSYKAGTTGIKTLWNKLFGGGGLTGTGVNFNDVVNVAEMYVKANNIYINGNPIGNDEVKSTVEGEGPNDDPNAPKASEFAKADKFTAFEQGVKDRKANAGASDANKAEAGSGDANDHFRLKVKAYIKKIDEEWNSDTTFRDRMQAWLIKWTDLTEEDLKPLDDLQIRETFEIYYENVKQKGGEHYELAKAFKDKYAEEFRTGERTVASTAYDVGVAAKDKAGKLINEGQQTLKEKVAGVGETLYNQANYTADDEQRNVVDDVKAKADAAMRAAGLNALGRGDRFASRYAKLKEQSRFVGPMVPESQGTGDGVKDSSLTARLREQVAGLRSKLSSKEEKDFETYYRSLKAESNEGLEALQETSEEQLHTTKEQTDYLAKTAETLDLIKEHLTKDESVRGDWDGDGIRNNSWQDRLRKYREKQQAKKDEAEAKKAEKEGGKETSDNAPWLGGVLGLLGGIKDSVVDGFKWVAGLLAAKKVGDVAGDVLGGGEGNDRKSRKGRKPKGPRVKPKGGIIRGAGRLAMNTGGWALRGALGLTTKLVVGSAGVLASAPVLITAATAGAVYGGYKGAQYLSRRAKVQPLEGLRFLQYGINLEDEEAVIAIRYFEREIYGSLKYDKYGIASLGVNTERLFEKYHDDFGLERVQSDFLEWRSWFVQRFSPVFLTNATHCRLVSKGKTDARTTFTMGNINLIDVDDEMRDDRKAEFIKNTVYAPEKTQGGAFPYQVMACPFKPVRAMVGPDGVAAEAANLLSRFSTDGKVLAERQEKALATEANARAVAYGKANEENDARLKAMAELAQKNGVGNRPNAMTSEAAQRALSLYGKPSDTKVPSISSVPQVEQPTPEQALKDVALSNMKRSIEAQVVVGSTLPEKELGDYILPTEGRISSPFGERVHPTRKTKHYHSGVDIAAPEGTPVVAAQEGVVVRRGYSDSYGNVVYVNHPDGTQTRYAHLSAFARGLRMGDEVPQGALLGYVGSTGVSTGPHLHFQHKKGHTQASPNINPFDAMGEYGKTLNALDAQASRAAQMESRSDIDPSIEGEFTLGVAPADTTAYRAPMNEAANQPLSLSMPSNGVTQAMLEGRDLEVARVQKATNTIADNTPITNSVTVDVDTAPIAQQLDRRDDKLAKEMAEIAKLLRDNLEKPVTVTHEPTPTTEGPTKPRPLNRQSIEQEKSQSLGWMDNSNGRTEELSRSVGRKPMFNAR